MDFYAISSVSNKGGEGAGVFSGSKVAVGEVITRP